MITKKKNRYYCEFCKKSGGHAGHMRKHEERCTLNPNRICGFCRLREDEQPPIKTLLDILPDPQKYKPDSANYSLQQDFVKAANLALKDIREIADCPACIMAALRQKGIPVPMVTDFNFKAECDSAWKEFNESQLER